MIWYIPLVCNDNKVLGPNVRHKKKSRINSYSHVFAIRCITYMTLVIENNIWMLCRWKNIRNHCSYVFDSRQVISIQFRHTSWFWLLIQTKRLVTCLPSIYSRFQFLNLLNNGSSGIQTYLIAMRFVFYCFSFLSPKTE